MLRRASRTAEALRVAPSGDALLLAAPVSAAEGAGTARDARRRLALATADVIAIVLAWNLAATLSPESSVTLMHPLMFAVPPLWLVLNRLLGLYDRDANLIHKSTLDELPRIVHSVTLGGLLVLFALPPLTDGVIARDAVAIFWLTALVSVVSARAAARTIVRRAHAPETVLIVGSGAVAGMLSRKLSQHPEYGVTLVGFVDSREGASGESGPDLPLLGTVDEFEEVCRRERVERVVIAFSALSHEALLNVIRASKRARIKISIVPRLFEVIGHRFDVDEVEGLTLLGLRGLNRSRSSLVAKRAIDMAGASLGIVVIAPVLAAIALAIKLTSRGPVFYAQRRIGRHNRPFTMFKFRTMCVGADRLKRELTHLNEADGVMFKIADDPRVTRVGRFLRQFSLDELPQLYNVLRGEMSLVGPRPLIPAENAHVLGWHRARLDLTPGLTGPWQVMGRTAIPFQEMVKMDYLYVAEWSLWNDVRLLLRTAPVVVFGRGH